jgi:hypothetical protein
VEGRQGALARDRAASDWNQDFGILIAVVWLRATQVLAIAEARGLQPKNDRRVAAWTSGQDPATNTTGFGLVLTPDSSLDDVPPLRELRPFHFSRRRRW